MKLVSPEASVDVAAALAELARVGYARLGAALSREGQALLGQRLEDLMLARLLIPGLFFQKDAASYGELTFGAGFQGPSLEYRKGEKLERDELFRAWIENPLFEEIARAHVGGEVALYRAVVFPKAAT